MNENVLFPTAASVDSQVPVVQISAGSMLRNAREAEGLHIATLAVLLKVPVKKLEALEADQFDLLLDNIFIRALAASVCRTLRIDSAPVLAKLPHASVPNLKTDEYGINTPFRTSGDSFGLSFLQHLTKPLVLAVLVLLVGVVVIVFFPITQRAEVNRSQKANDANIAAEISTLPLSSSVADRTNFNDITSLKSHPSSLDIAVVLNPTSVASSTSLPSVVLDSQSVLVPGSGATTGVIVIKAHGASWVEVVDGSKVVQVRKTMISGETVGASGILPLSVVVGRADSTEVQVRGKPIDLGSIAKDNVARFEVK